MNYIEHEHDNEEYVFVDINHIKELVGSHGKNRSIADDDESFDLCDEELGDDLSQCPSASASLCSENLFQITESCDSTKDVLKNSKNAQSSSYSRLSNKKRRKQIKKMKKAEAAAFAAAALANRASAKVSEVSQVPNKKVMSTKACKSSIAVLCATQSYAEFRNECQVRN